MLSDLATAALLSIIGLIAAAIGAVLTDAIKELAVVTAAGSALGVFLGSIYTLLRGRRREDVDHFLWVSGIAGGGFAAYLFVFERLIGL